MFIVFQVKFGVHGEWLWVLISYITLYMNEPVTADM